MRLRKDTIGPIALDGTTLRARIQRWSREHKARGQGQRHKRIRGQGQGQPFRGQECSRPRLRPSTKDTSASALQKKKVFTKIFRLSPQNFNNSKNSAVLEPRPRPIFEDLRPRGQGQGLQNVSSRTSSRPRTSSRTPPLLEYQSKIIAQKTCKQVRIWMKAERNYKKASDFFERILSQFEHNCRVKSIGKKIEGLACARKFHRGQDSGRS